jgi:hypothetical protein
MLAIDRKGRERIIKRQRKLNKPANVGSLRAAVLGAKRSGARCRRPPQRESAHCWRHGLTINR